MSGDTMIGRWDHWHTANMPTPMGDSEAYRLGATWLADCDVVEDWGCGGRWLSTLLHGSQEYVGVDGSGQPDVRVDLREYVSDAPGKFMRAVLEHNYEWESILDGFLAGPWRRVVLALFTPWHDGSLGAWHEIGYDDDPGVPILSFDPAAILGPCALAAGDLAGMHVAHIESPNTAYGREVVIRLARAPELL